MINLLAAYYENIGPFRDKSCSIFFDEWKYLIKAPIWSWKSFLFFDAPRYALYKDSSRNMLNLHCKNWEISMIFEVDGEYYLIKRILLTFLSTIIAVRFKAASKSALFTIIDIVRFSGITLSYLGNCPSTKILENSTFSIFNDFYSDSNS